MEISKFNENGNGKIQYRYQKIQHYETTYQNH